MHFARRLRANFKGLHASWERIHIFVYMLWLLSYCLCRWLSTNLVRWEPHTQMNHIRKPYHAMIVFTDLSSPAFSRSINRWWLPSSSAHSLRRYILRVFNSRSHLVHSAPSWQLYCCHCWYMYCVLCLLATHVHTHIYMLIYRRTLIMFIICTDTFEMFARGFLERVR